MKLASIFTFTILLLASTQTLAQDSDCNHPKHLYGQLGEKKGHSKHLADDCCDDKKVKKHDYKKHDHKKKCKKSHHKHGHHHGHDSKHCAKHNHKHHGGNACDCECRKKERPQTDRPAKEDRIEMRIGGKRVEVILK